MTAPGQLGALAASRDLVVKCPAIARASFAGAADTVPGERCIKDDLALVRDPSLLFTMSKSEIESLQGSTRQIASIIAVHPWISTNDGVFDAALYSFGISDDFLAYIEWLESAPVAKAV